jgi:hypothetical protein
VTSERGIGRSCPWCAAPAADEATNCAACGAALAQRESLGDVAIPGLTAVDPALQAIDGRPMHLAGPSASHGVANGVLAAAVLGGPVGFVALGGIAAVAAAEYAGAKRDGVRGAPDDLTQIGRPSALAQLALERAEADGPASDPEPPSATAAPGPDPWRDLPAAPPANEPELGA